MDRKGLIETLKDLKDNRRLSSESKAIIKPFIGNFDQFSFSFLESMNTISSRVEEKYSKGKTVLAKFLDSELECSILFPSSKNDWVDGLKKEDVFFLSVEILELDNLYQRVVLGSVHGGEGKGENLSTDVQNSYESEISSEQADDHESIISSVAVSAHSNEKPSLVNPIEVNEKSAELPVKKRRNKLFQNRNTLNLTEKNRKRFKIGSKLSKISKFQKRIKHDEFSSEEVLYRVAGGSVVGILGIVSLAGGWVFFTLICFGIAWYIIVPLVKEQN